MDARPFADKATAAFDIHRYRPFIDGLRAVSIVAVVGYHAEVPGFSGGFIGVDVFFVISGFLIIGQILQGLEAGTFSFADFYARRVLRILPPLFLVLLVTLALAPLIMISPEQVRSFGLVGAHSAGMIANHYFAGHQGYFEQGAELNPLLHTWTLSVEEQFYLVAPLFLFALYAIASRARIEAGRMVAIAFAVVFVVSLVGAFNLFRMPQADIFYIAFFRVWEFLAGGALGLLVPLTARSSPSTLGWAAVAGLGLIVAAVTGFAMRAEFPAYALLPVAGASVVLLSGTIHPGGVACRLLATAPFVAIGRVSYGWYLWHWPLLVFARLVDFGELSLLSGILVSAVSFGLAVVTYFLVELPIKRWRRRLLPTRMRGGIIAAGCFGAALLAASYLVFGEVRGNGIEQAWARTFDVGTEVRLPRCAVSEAGAISRLCLDDNDVPASLLIGDSHAGSFARTLAARVARSGSGLVEILLAGCPPLADAALWLQGRQRTVCRVTGPRIRSAMSSLRIGGAVVFARWGLYTGLGEGIGADALPRNVQFLGPNGGDVAADQFAFMAAALRSTLGELGGARVLLIAPTPEFPLDPRECLARTDWYGVSRDGCAVPRTEVDERREESLGALRAVAASMPNVRVIDPIELFCGDDGWCRAHDGNAILFRDDDHLSALGSQRLYDAFKDDFAWMLGGASAALTR